MNKSNTKLIAYSAMAGALLMANNSNATIIHTDVNPDSVLNLANGDVFDLDLDGDNQKDFGFEFFSWTYTTSSYWSTSYIAKMTFAGNAAVGTNNINALSYGAVINSTAAFVSSSVSSNASILGQYFFIYTTTWSTSSISTNGNFLDSTNKYIGVQFLISGNTHYGWIQVSVSEKADTITIIDYAYESVPNYGIQAGITIATGINDKEVKSTVYSFGRDIHISSRGRGLASVYNLAGQEVASKSFNGGKSSINMKGNPGVYVVRISQNGKTTNHKVQIN